MLRCGRYNEILKRGAQKFARAQTTKKHDNRWTDLQGEGTATRRRAGECRMRSVRGDAAPSPLLCLLPPSIATPYPALSVSRSFAEAKKLAKVRRSGCIIYHVLLQSDLDPIPFDLNVNSMQKKCSSAQLSINGDMICERKLTNKGLHG